IGAGVRVTAGNIGVLAQTDMPITNSWTNWNGLGASLSHLNGNLGVVNNIMTSYASATGGAEQLGLAGAVNYFAVNNNTVAWVGDGAQLTQTGGSSSWSTTLEG